MIFSLWRISLLPASFRGVTFHIEASTSTSGRRQALIEYPKRDRPDTEDMGRLARRFAITGYVIGADFRVRRDALVAALEGEGPGLLVLPTAGEYSVVSGPYTVVERRDRGGFAELELSFIESGDGYARPAADTRGAVLARAWAARVASIASMKLGLRL